MLVPALMLSMLLLPVQQSESPEKLRRQRYPEFSQIVDLAEGAPPELRSLALTQVASQPGLTDLKWKKELLAEAFDVALSVKVAMPLSPVAAPEGPTPVMPTRIQRAVIFNNGLDRLTLLTNAVVAMQVVDPREARKMFENIPYPEAITESCAAEYVPNPSSYFSAAAAVHLPQAQLETIFARTTFPAAAPALLKLALASGLTPTTLSSMTDDSRAWALTMDKVTASMEELLTASNADRRGPLLELWRAYIVDGLQVTQCKEIPDPVYYYAKMLEKAVKAFNDHLSVAATKNIAAISSSDLEFGKLDIGVSETPPVLSPHLKQLQRQFFSLFPQTKKDSPEWQASFSSFLADIESISADDLQPDEDLFWIKSQEMSAAALLPPPGSMRDETVRRFLGFLAVSNVPPDNVAEWYELVNSWIQLSSSLDYPRAKTLALLQANNQPLIRLIAHLNALQLK